MDTTAFDVPQEQSEQQLAILDRALVEATALEQSVAQMEEDLKAAKAALNALKTGKIPDLMVEMGMSELVWDGWKVKVGDFVSGSLPKEETSRAAAIAWLEQHEAGDLIKTEVSLSFGREDREAAVELAQQLEADGYAPTVESGVHAQTLASFARERLASGEPIDLEVLGLKTGKVAKIAKMKV